MVLSIPQELTDKIIGYLVDDKDALEACSIVSYSFVQECQRSLFSRIIIKGPKPYPINTQWLRRGGSSVDFMRLLDRSPHLAEYVKSVEIVEVVRPIETSAGELEDASFNKWLLEDEVVASCLLRLPNLEGLLLRSYRYDGNGQSRPQAVLASLAKPLQMLHSVTWAVINDLPPSLLEHLPNLRHAYVAGLMQEPFLDLSQPGNPPPITPLRLETLHLRTAYEQNRLISWVLQSRLSIRSLKTLIMDCEDDWGDIRTNVADLVARCSNSLEELILHALFDIKDVALGITSEPVQLGALVALRKLRLFFEVNGGRNPAVSLPSLECLVSWLLSGLKKFSPDSNRIEYLEIQIESGSYYIGPSSDSWPEIVEELLGDRFPCLKEVRILLFYFRSEGAFEYLQLLLEREDIRERISKRGIILTISTSPETTVSEVYGPYFRSACPYYPEHLAWHYSYFY